MYVRAEQGRRERSIATVRGRGGTVPVAPSGSHPVYMHVFLRIFGFSGLPVVLSWLRVSSRAF